MAAVRNTSHTIEQKKTTAVPIFGDKTTTAAAAATASGTFSAAPSAEAVERAAADREGKGDADVQEKLSTAQQIDRSFMIIHRSLDRLEHTFDRFERRLAARRRLLYPGGNGRGHGQVGRVGGPAGQPPGRERGGKGGERAIEDMIGVGCAGV